MTARTSSKNVTSCLYNRSSIIPSRLACKTFANLLIYTELTLGTPKRSFHVIDWVRTAAQNACAKRANY